VLWLRLLRVYNIWTLDFEKIIAFFTERWAVIRPVFGTFLTIMLLMLGGGIAIGSWYYSGRIDTMKEELAGAQGQVVRYRVALGIDKASAGALVELNNQELALKTESIVAKLREFSHDLQFKEAELQKLVDSGKIKKSDMPRENMRVMTEVSQAFDENLASDALNVDNELRKRMTPEALSHVVRAPAFVAGGSRVTFLGLMRDSPMASMMIPAIANEMEQMYKLLPLDRR
jgi:hypothetical protein